MTKKLRLCLTIILSGLIAMAAATCIVVSVTAKSYNTNGAMAYAIAPEIMVQYPSGYSEDNIPNAVKDVEYNIFDATAKDFYGKSINVSTKVYAHYNSESKSLIRLVDGVVIPKSYGIYTVEYKAQDSYGNSATLLYDFICEPKEELVLKLSDDKVVEGVSGIAVKVSEYEVLNAVGNTMVEICAKLKSTDIIYDIDVNTLSFVPMYSGEYEIIYKVTDYNQTATNKYSVTVTENASPVIFEQAQLNRYYIVGYEYELPIITCYHFADGKPVVIRPEITVKTENYKEITLVDGIFKPEFEGYTVVTYTATYNGVSVSKHYSVVCVDVGYTSLLDMGKYFVAKSGGINVQTDSSLELSTAVNGTLVDFINPVSTARLELNFGIKPESNFNQLDIYLTDYADADNVVKISIMNTAGGNAYFILNDMHTEKFATEINFRKLSTIKFNYNEKTRQLTLGESYAVTISNTLNGEKFTGFNNATVYLSFGFNQVIESSGIILYKINNQALSRATKDSVDPQLVFYSFDKGVKQIGDIVEIDRIFVGDTLSPYCKVNYSVTAPDGSFVTSLDGVLLNGENIDYTRSYSFKVEQLGSYLVAMQVYDTACGKINDDIKSYSINVKDGVAPTIKLSASGSLSVKLGGVIKLRKPIFYDDISTELTTEIFILRPDGVIDYVEDLNKLQYKPNTKGEYVIYYYAMDEAGNVTMIDYSVTVS